MPQPSDAPLFDLRVPGFLSLGSIPCVRMAPSTFTAAFLRASAGIRKPLPGRHLQAEPKGSQNLKASSSSMQLLSFSPQLAQGLWIVGRAVRTPREDIQQLLETEAGRSVGVSVVFEDHGPPNPSVLLGAYVYRASEQNPQSVKFNAAPKVAPADVFSTGEASFAAS